MITTRKRTPEDEPFLRSLFSSLRSAEFAPLQLGEAQLAALIDMQFKAQQAHYRTAFPNAEFLIILNDEVPVGNITVETTSQEIRLIDIGLLPDNRGEGIGSTLLKELQTQGKRIILHVEQSNPAKHLYEKLGFQELESNGIHKRMLWMP